MSKAYLAFKAVSNDNRSAWVRHPFFATSYTLGERVDAKEARFPFYIATIDEISECDRRTGQIVSRQQGNSLDVSTSYQKILVVRIQAKDVAHELPYVDYLNEAYHWRDNADSVFAAAEMDYRKYMGARSVLPIAEVPQYAPLYPFIKEIAKKAKIPFLRNTRIPRGNEPFA